MEKGNKDDQSHFIAVEKLAKERGENTATDLKALKNAEKAAAKLIDAERAAGTSLASRILRHPLLWAALIVLGLLALFARPSRADDSAPTSNDSSKGERLSVDELGEKYWAKGKESELRVIQNRLYSKARKFELGVLGGRVSSDPFLDVHNLGGELSYYFTEYLGAGLIAWRSFASKSDVLNQLEASGTTANTNAPFSFYGAQAMYSPIYGKLSVLGALIIYYDMHLAGGAGLTKHETGQSFTPFVAVGQQVYLTRMLALHLDYRFMRYNELVPQKVAPSKGRYAGERSSNLESLTLGVSLLLDLF